jgi:hypothetical protein
MTYLLLEVTLELILGLESFLIFEVTTGQLLRVVAFQSLSEYIMETSQLGITLGKQ